MISRKIDLTEQRDFYTPSTPSVGFYIPVYRGGNKLTFEEYKTFRWQEKFFGLREHANERWEVFGNPSLTKYTDSHCANCGKELKLPWGRLSFPICTECYYIMRHEINYGIFPWYKRNRTQDSREIFHLR